MRSGLLALALTAVVFAAQQTTHEVHAVGEGVFQLDKTAYATNEGTAVQVTVVRTEGGTLTQDVQVILAVDGVTEFDIPSAEATKLLTFPAGSNLSSKPIFIQTLNKEQFSDRTIQVTILSVSAGGQLPLNGQTTAPITLRGSGTPRVLSVTPQSGGSWAGENTILTVTGENFIVSGATIQSTTIAVEFWGFFAPGAEQSLPVPGTEVQVISPTLMYVRVPVLLADYVLTYPNQLNATYDVRVKIDTTPPQVPISTFLSPRTPSDQFVYTTGPTVTQLSVQQGPPTGGTSVVVSGTKFPTGAQNTPCPLNSVTFGGLQVTSCKFGGTNQFVVTTPAHISGFVDVVVFDGVSKYSPAVPSSRYNYQGVPVITNLSPNFGPQAGGTSVLISGSGFFVGSMQPTAVLFGGNAAQFTMISDTQIRATAPPGTGTQQVKIVHPISGTSDFRTEANYTYSVGPVINSLSPTHGPASGGTVVTISGGGFAAGAIVKFNDIQAFVTSVTETSIIATAPAGSGIVNVSVAVNTTISPSGPQTQFSYDGPTVTLVSPNAGPPAGGTAIVLRGTNFTTAARVIIGTNVIVPTFVDPTTLTLVTPPALAPGAVHIHVTTGSGTSPETADDLFTYTNGPIVDSVNPDNGPTIGGTIVIITGKNFSTPLTVSFGTVQATSFNVNSATQITVLSPPNPVAGPADVRVTKGADVSPVSPKSKFNYTASTPKVTQLTPNTGTTFGGTEVTITGLGLSGAACPGAVKFGPVPASVCTVVNDSTITVTTPPNVAGATVVTVTTANGTSDIVPNFTYTSPNSPGGSTAPPAPGAGGTTSYTLHARWTLLTWTGNPGVSVSDAIRGTGVPGATDLSQRITAIYLWDAAGSVWKGYFTGADGIPGANDFSQLTPGAVYWVAIQGTGQVEWVVVAPL
ncbi:MAG: IPT/TIG domain-containing protein [bacterium]